MCDSISARSLELQAQKGSHSKGLFIVFTTSVLATPAAAALTHWGPQNWGPMGWHPGGFGFLFLLIPLFWIGLIILIVSLATRRRRRFWAANGGYPGTWGAGPGGRYGWGAGPGYGGYANGWGGASGSSEAEKTLAERFAQGDIDEVEYRARLEVLRANRPGGPTPPAPAA